MTEPNSDKADKAGSTAPVVTPAGSAGESKGNSVKVVAGIVAALVAVVFMLEPTIEKMIKSGPATDAPESVQNAHAFQECVSEVLRKSTRETNKRKLELGELKTDQDRETAIEQADLTPDERKSVFDGCKSMFPPSSNAESNAHLTLVEGEHDDPVTKEVRVAIEAGSRYVEPGGNGEAVVPYFPSTCGKSGCAVTIEKSSAYELAGASVFDKDALTHVTTVKLRRKGQSIAIALGRHAQTPHVWIEGTNADVQVWNATCQPNDSELRCRRVQAQDGSATFSTRGTLTSLTLRLSRDGDDWSEPAIEIQDVAAQLHNGILQLPEPAARVAGPACASDANWFKNRVRQFTGWQDTRNLSLSATVSADGVSELKSVPPLGDQEKSALAAFLRAPPSAKPGCTKTNVRADAIAARAQH